MLDFSFTPEQEQLRRTLRAFALKELLPHYGRWDRERRYPKDQIKKICRLVWADVSADDMDLISAGILAEEVARGDFNCVLMSLEPVQLRAFLREAPEDLKARWIPKISSGEALIGLALTEPEAATQIELARWLCYRILWKHGRGEPCAAEGAMAKWWAPKVAVEIIHECLLLHGHYGYTQELPIEQRLRDVIGWQIGDGTPQIQKLVIARHLLGRDFAPET
jgi:alkylation response protein AidB-like acyl-CoA dehydrogenase